MRTTYFSVLLSLSMFGCSEYNLTPLFPTIPGTLAGAPTATSGVSLVSLCDAGGP